MIKIEINGLEFWDREKEEFSTVTKIFAFENSLRAISKWESKWKIPFLEKKPKTYEQTMHYYECMCMTSGFRREFLTKETIEVLNKYIQESHTATTLPKGNSSNKQVYTSELIYAYMCVNNIPFECDKWEINRLMNLLGCINIISNPQQKKRKSSTQIAKDYAQINNERLKKYKTQG